MTLDSPFLLGKICSEERHVNLETLKNTIMPAIEIAREGREGRKVGTIFVVSDDGAFISACRYLNASSGNIDLPLGLGSRHMAAASISKETNAVAVVVSESSIVRVFDDGLLMVC